VHPDAQPAGHDGSRRHVFVPVSNAVTAATSAFGAPSFRYCARNGARTSRRNCSAVFASNRSTVFIVELKTDGSQMQASIGKHGEVDVYTVNVGIAGSYIVQTSGVTDVVMTLAGPNNEANVIAEDDDSGVAFNARIVSALTPGKYVVRVRHYRPTGTGSYSISARKL